MNVKNPHSPDLFLFWMVGFSNKQSKTGIKCDEIRYTQSCPPAFYLCWEVICFVGVFVKSGISLFLQMHHTFAWDWKRVWVSDWMADGPMPGQANKARTIIGLSQLVTILRIK